MLISVTQYLLTYNFLLNLIGIVGYMTNYNYDVEFGYFTFKSTVSPKKPTKKRGEKNEFIEKSIEKYDNKAVPNRI